MYLASTVNPSEHDTWLIDSGASCHMTPHREWFCEYEKYNGGDGLPASIIGHGRVKLKIKDGRIRTLPGVLHIPNLAKNCIFVGKMDVAGVNTVWRWWLQNGSRINGIDEGSLVWKSVQIIVKNHH